jgi:regulator of RNase E activity RraA
VPSTTAIADVLALLGCAGTVQTGWLGPVAHPAEGTVWGRAVTVEIDAVEAGGSFQPLYDLLSRDLSGRVVVVGGAERVDGAVWGQILSRAAAQAGAVGAVVSGHVRDRDALAAEGIAVWGGPLRTAGPMGRATVVGVGGPVAVGGVTVAEHDVVVLDHDGVVVLAEAEADAILAAARRYDEGEAEVLERLGGGTPLSLAYESKKRAIADIRAGVP